MDEREEKLRSEIIQHIHDWIKDGMREEELATRKIDEIIASALSQARSQAYAECIRIVGEYSDTIAIAGESGTMLPVAPAISQAIREAASNPDRSEK